MFDGDALTAEEVAKMLRVSKNSVYRLAQSGELASYRVGRKLRFTLRDVEAYTRAGMRSQKGAQAADGASSPSRTAEAGPSPSGNAREGVSEIPSAFSLDCRKPFVIAGNDLSGDIIAHALAAAGLPIARAYVGSYTALVNLYAKQANAALVHLYDQRTNAYNVPSVQRIAPGMPVVVIRLLKRKQGFIVQAGNPKKLTTWGGLLREGVRLTNRERGCGTRVLLDEKLLSLEARPEMVEGYDLECATGLEAATLVSKGCADVTIGIERLAKELPGLAFVPLQTEWLDIAVEKSQRTAPLVREIRKIAESKSFRYAIDAIEGYEAANTGAIVYES